MSTTFKNVLSESIVQAFLFDMAALGFIVLMPAASHLTGIPFYFFEPMRIMLALALIFSNRYNSYAVAIALPLFSFLVSGHPVPLKMMIIMAELFMNVWLFIVLYKKTNKAFVSMFSAIAFSKIFCYLMYWIIFSWAFVIEESQPVFMLSQVAITLVLSVVVSFAATKYNFRSVEN